MGKGRTKNVLRGSALSVKELASNYANLPQEVELIQCTGLMTPTEEDIYESDLLKNEFGLVVVTYDEKWLVCRRGR